MPPPPPPTTTTRKLWHFTGERASCHSARPCFFLTLEGSKSTHTSLCFPPYLPDTSLNFSLDYWRSHQGQRPQAEAAEVLLSSRYCSSSSVNFHSWSYCWISSRKLVLVIENSSSSASDKLAELVESDEDPGNSHFQSWEWEERLN